MKDVLADSVVRQVFEAWRATRDMKEPPFSGGVLDSWPNIMAQGFAICRREYEAVLTLLKQEASDA